MKVLLTHPINRNPMLISDDLGLGYIASGLRQAGIEVKLELRAIKEDEFIKELKNYRPDIVGIKTFCTSTRAVNRTIDLIRSVLPGIHCVIGGPQVNAMPELILKYVKADAAFHGDSERSFPRYVIALRDGLKIDGIPGLIRFHNGKFRVSTPDILEDLDRIGMPAWDMFPPHKGGQLQLSRFSPAASVITSRGCSGQCTFCSEAGGRLRFRSSTSVMDELIFLKKNFGVKEILFQDSNFMAKKDRVEELCRLMIEKKLRLAWSVPYGTRWETLTPDLLALMKRAGCYRVSIGVETGSSRLQKKIRKNIHFSGLKKRLRNCRSSGVEIMANFMYGFPGETWSEMHETLRLALELDIDYSSFYIYTPYPGSRLYDELVRDEVIRPDDYQEVDKFYYENNLSEVTPQKLYWLVRRSLAAFYFRPRILKKMIGNLRYPNFYTVLIKLLYYEFLFPKFTQKHAY